MTPRDGTTYGQILLSSPAVDTRERLINDRLDQLGWLNGQLDESRDATFGINGSRLRRSARAIEAGVSANVAPQQAELFRSQQRGEQAREKLQQKLDQARYETAIALEAEKLKQLRETGKLPAADTSGSAAPPDRPAAVDRPVPDMPDFGTGPAPADVANWLPEPPDVPAPTPTDLFRDRLALREEIRNEIINTNLDDRHDVRGNALYRLSFDATLLPGNDTGAYALIGVCIQRPGSARCNGGQPTTIFDDQDAVVLQRAFSQRYLDNVALINADIESHAAALARDGDLLVLNNSTRRWLSQTAAALMKQPMNQPMNQETVEVLGSLVRQQQLVGRDQARMAGPSHAQVSDAVVNDLCSRMPATGELPLIPGVLAANLTTVRHACGAADRPTERRLALLTEAASFGAAMAMVRQVHETSTGSADIATFFAGYRAAGTDGTPFTLRDGALLSQLDWRRLVADGSKRQKLEIYAYGATPKESVQRISDLVTRREQAQFALQVQALKGATGLAAATNFMSINEGIFAAMRRQPLVVGFGHTSAQGGTSGDPVGAADFGWILGPRYAAAENGKTAYFRQAVVQNGLSAVVSVPAWWDRIELVVRRYWVSERGTVLSVHAGRNAASSVLADVPKGRDDHAIVYPITLPGARAEIMNILNASPRIELEERRLDAPIWELKYGQPAELMIRGRNLWRNPQVRLGAQFASRLRTMPDMQGIVAIFDTVREDLHGKPLWFDSGRTKPSWLPVTVATTNDFELVGYANITAVKPPEVRQSADGGPVLLAGSANALLLAQPLGGYHSISYRYRQAGTNKAFQSARWPTARANDRKLLVTPGALPGIASGKSVELQMLVARSEGAEPENLPVGGPLVRYGKGDEWRARVTIRAGTGKDAPPAGLTIAFPPGYATAMNIANGVALLEVSGPAGSARTLACQIDACELNASHLPAGVPLQQLRLRPAGLREETPNPFSGPIAP